MTDVRYFYHSDHLGSSSMLTDEWGDVYQTLSYMLFGEVLVDLRQDEDIFTPYQFNAKELDEETGLNYYVARYYNSLFSFFITSDPLYHLSPHMTSYHYCLNNPVNRIDPTGKIDYDVKDNGHIVMRNSFLNSVKGFLGIRDKEDRLIASNGEVLSVKSGTMNNVSEYKEKTKIIGHYFSVSDDKSAESVHNFLSENTSVEWGRTEYENSQGTSNNVISTSHDGETERVAPKIATTLLKNNFNVITMTHSHLDGTSPSGYDSWNKGKGDKSVVDYLDKHYPQNNITHKVYDVKNNKIYSYDKNGVYKTEKKR